MNEINVTKSTLLEKLTENREIHKSEYKEMMETYHQEVIRGLSKLLKAAKKKPKQPVTSLNIPIPISYINEYDTVIGMLEMSTNEDFVITQAEYKKYVMNEWSWTNVFNSLKAAYNG